MAGDSKPKFDLSLFLWISAAVVAVWLLSICVMYLIAVDAGERGALGDQFGAVTSLFTGLAFSGLIAALLMQQKELALQRDELALQREELRLTREEHRGSKEQLAAQNKSLQIQTFENTFFEMVRLHHSIISGMTYSHLRENAEGRASFSLLYGAMNRSYENVKNEKNIKRDEIEKTGIEVIRLAYSRFLQPTEGLISHYFRNLYCIIKYIDESDVVEPAIYTGIVRAQLSTDEMYLLFYNGLSEVGANFKTLIERHSLLENMSFSSLPDAKVVAGFYEPEAFGDTPPPN